MRLAARSIAAREAISGLLDERLTPLELLDEVDVRVRRLVPFDVGGFFTLDPETVLPNCRHSFTGELGLCGALLRNEAVTPDLNKFAELARRTRATAGLREAEEATGQLSARRHAILTPTGIDDEVRIAFRADGSMWGGAFIMRAHGSPPFNGDELLFLESIAADVGRGIQVGLSQVLPMQANEDDAIGAGALLVNERLHVVSASPAAQQWQRLMPPEASVAINAIALRAQAAPPDAPAQRARVNLLNGEWLILTAAQLVSGIGGGAMLTAITLSPASPVELVPLLVRLHGLSVREREVAELLQRGLGTDDAATRLHISPHTVRDHVKSIFAKLGVRSRSELMAVLAGEIPVAAVTAPA
ncbi:MAG TPA: helix-turn-helix transcriptional regulator [Conexibacter sp.]|jgi:DNA-binding CsgD family transcriptional regulator